MDYFVDYFRVQRPVALDPVAEMHRSGAGKSGVMGPIVAGPVADRHVQQAGNISYCRHIHARCACAMFLLGKTSSGHL
jgi:hypothetical protein